MRLLLVGATLAGAAQAQNSILFTDDFETNSSTNYTVVDDGFPDGTQSFAHDYSTDGIPSAPRSAGGSTRGLKLTANDMAGNADAWTLFHDTPVTSDHYFVIVDVWMNYGTFGPSTEFAHVGVGGNGTTFNSMASPISGSGMFMAFDGDGDHATLDYAMYRDASVTPMGLASGLLRRQLADRSQRYNAHCLHEPLSTHW